MISIRTIAFTLALPLLATPSFAQVIHVQTCGQRVPDSEDAVLDHDLDCGTGSTAVTLGPGSTLDLNGYSIHVPDGFGVWCVAAAHCEIDGGGEGGAIGHITGAKAGVYLQRRAKLEMNGVSIEDCESGILSEDWNSGSGANARLTNVEISGSESAAIQVGKLRLSNVNIHDNPGHGINGLSTTKITASSLTVTGNAYSEGCQYYGCAGIDGGKIKGEGLVVMDNGGIGIHAVSVSLFDSIIVNNVRAGATRDLITGTYPRIKQVSCGISAGWGSQSGTPWGVCSHDDPE